MDFSEINHENLRRNKALQTDHYNPLTGVGCAGERVLVAGEWVPQAVIDERPDYASLTAVERQRLRAKHDFEFWCATCATVRDKYTGRPVPFVLNAPQRRVAAEMERQRQAHQPVRLILLKARQWGGSTLVQMYMAWMQLVRHKGWNSLICGQKRQSARSIKGMYNLLLRHYPSSMLDDADGPVRFRNFEGGNSVQTLTGRECFVVMGSAVNDDDVRSFSIAMAHLTEVAFWPDTPMHSPEDVMRSVNGTVGRIEDSVVVLESTANGMGQYFHTEWLRACSGKSDKTPIFVPWYEIEAYRSPVRDVAQLWGAMDAYERQLWDEGLTLEMIQWYHDKRREALSHSAMMAEFPTTATEAFVCSGFSVFDLGNLERLRRHCKPPVDVGDIEADHRSLASVHFVPASTGLLKVWSHPQAGERYLVAVDVGGRSDKADYSVIAVVSCTAPRQRLPEVVAQWRGHIDHDLLAWKAAQVAQYYNHAKLVVESNTLETRQGVGGTGQYILDVLQGHYTNLYRRTNGRLGFHTDVGNKSEMINNLISCVRDLRYIERDHEAVDEMAVYEQHGASFGARRGHHDDILITRAIAFWVMQIAPGQQPPRRAVITPSDKRVLEGGYVADLCELMGG